MLAADRRVLVPDLPGHGFSARPDATYELAWYGRVMAGWFAALKLDRVDVVGHSFGGGVAMAMLCECPERIRRLALVSSGGLGREITLALRLAAIPWVVERFGQPFMGPCTRLVVRLFGDVLSKEAVAKLSAMNAQRGSARAFARTVRDIIGWRGQRRSFFEHAHTVPNLPSMAVFWGDRDTVIPHTHAQALADFVDGVRVVLFEGCGHYPHHEQPERLVAELRGFLDDPAVSEPRLRAGGSVTELPVAFVDTLLAGE
jgi:pimeloyl-ACP methyl ester carboxylesterase